MCRDMALLFFFFLCFYIRNVLCYIPAVGTNIVDDTIGGLNISTKSSLQLEWSSNGSDSEDVSYQIVGHESSGISQGALVHFSETKYNNDTPPTSTPWIALVSCDSNATNMSLELDIFTLARDKGAVAALLYSLDYATCAINPEYADPYTFEQVFDVFATLNSSVAYKIEYQFGQPATNQSHYWYDPEGLNDAGTAINETIRGQSSVQPGYLFATLRAFNATGEVNQTNNPGSQASDRSTSGNSNTALAMIILYAITGCVSALFCVVIVTGAVRAIRHPERYGPRANRGRNGSGIVESHARGLGRAILDTFPIVKFGSSQDSANKSSQPSTPSGHRDLELGAMEASRTDINVQPDESTRDAPTPAQAVENVSESDARAVPRRRAIPSTEGQPRDATVIPEAIGRETCPICIVDFAEGDDLRVLPCEGRHRFHRDCVDPWLLELSSSCPICRQDFSALEDMMSRDDHSDSEDEPEPPTRPVSGVTPSHSHPHRFSRYIRSAIRRRNRTEERQET